MTTPHPLTPQLAQMPALAELFRLFLSGKHLNRMAEPALWAERAARTGLRRSFVALGFELRVDARGFAWFHSTDASSNIGKVSRQLALLFMVIFDAQTNAGKALQRFTDWLIDREWLAEVHEQQKDLLDAEGLSPRWADRSAGPRLHAGICSGGTGRLAAVARRLPLPGPL